MGIIRSSLVCVVTLLAASVANGQVVSLSQSSWGTAANPPSNNLTTRMPKWVPLNLPVNTSTWFRDTTLQNATCDANTFAAIQTRFTNAAENTVIVLPNCTINLAPEVRNDPLRPLTDRNQNQQIWYLGTKDGIEFLGQANTKFLVSYPAGTLSPANLPIRPIRTVLFTVGNSNLTPIASCNWVGGYDLGTKRVNLDSACGVAPSGANGWYPGDIIRVSTDSFPNQGRTSVHKTTYRIGCIDGPISGTSDRVGPAASCAELTGDNQIALDRPLYLNYNPGFYFVGTIPGKRIEHLERKGGGTRTNNIAENIGFRNIEFEHDHPFTQEARNPVIRWEAAVDGWAVNNTFQNWGGSWIIYSGLTGRILTKSNVFRGPLWRARCLGDLLSVQRTNPARIVVESSGCEETGPNGEQTGGEWNESTVWFSENVGEPALANKFFRYTRVGFPSGGSITLELPGINGTNFNTNPGGFIVNHNSWNIGASYSNGGTSEVQIIDNTFINPRVGPLLQGGAGSHVIAYNYMVTDIDKQCSRGVFFHGNGSGAANLIEGNDMDCAMVPNAFSNRDDDGEGLHTTLFQNRWRNTGAGTSHNGQFQDQCPRGTLCTIEQTDQNGASTEYTHIIGNVFYDFHSPTSKFDLVDNRDVGGGAVTPPYFQWKLYFAKNLFYSRNDIDDNFDPLNPTTLKPDVVAGDVEEAYTARAAYANFTPPSSLIYSSVPDFWCTQGGAFPSIGAFYDDMTPGTGTYAKLPAQRRYEGLPCSTAGGDSVAPGAPTGLLVTGTN